MADRSIDVRFRFSKPGHEDVETTETFHELGKIHVFFPDDKRIGEPCVVTVQNGNGEPLEGVKCEAGAVLPDGSCDSYQDMGTTDATGKLTLTVPVSWI